MTAGAALTMAMPKTKTECTHLYHYMPFTEIMNCLDKKNDAAHALLHTLPTFNI